MITIPKIFIINLKKDHQKRQHMQALCDKYSLEVEFIEAVDGSQLSEEEISRVYSEQQSISSIGRGLSRGEIGCALSHKKIYQKMLDENMSQAVIFEDDIELNEKLVNLFHDDMELPSNMELLLLGYWYYGITNTDFLISYRKQIEFSDTVKLVRFIKNMHGTYGYLITQDGSKKLLTYLNEKIYMPIDHYTGDEKFVNLYGVYPSVVTISDKFDMNTELEKERQHEKMKNRNNISENGEIKIIFKKLKIFNLLQWILSKYRIIKRNFCYALQRMKNKKDYR